MARYKPKVFEDILMTGIAEDSKSVGKTKEGIICFVEGAVPGDVVDVWVYNKKKGYYIGNVERMVKASPFRVDPACKHFGVCGGCKWQHLDYTQQLLEKENKVSQALSRIGKVIPLETLPIMPCDNPYYYRNKLEFTFSNKRWLTSIEISDPSANQAPSLGFHRPGAFDKIVDINQCLLQSDPSNDIRLLVKRIALDNDLTFFDLRQQTGLLRNLVIRNTTMGQIMVTLVLTSEEKAVIDLIFNTLIQSYPTITTLVYIINSKPNDSTFDLPFHIWYGPGYIEEQLGDVIFRIGPKSFFQTNTPQTINLYKQAVEFAQLSSTDVVYDLYTGLGSIALYIAKQCKAVIGIEYIQEAINDALENAQLNQIDNVRFYAGDVKDVLVETFIQSQSPPQVIITDPPRAGMHPDVIQSLLTIKADRIVYISCNPSTQARDIQLLSEHYVLSKLRAVDMFPHTNHVESIALLELKS